MLVSMAPKNSANKSIPVQIPIENLQADTVQSIAEEFILREGTDYGAVEISFEAKRNQVLRQIQNEELVILFDTELQSVTLRTIQDWQILKRQIPSSPYEE